MNENTVQTGTSDNGIRWARNGFFRVVAYAEGGWYVQHHVKGVGWCLMGNDEHIEPAELHPMLQALGLPLPGVPATAPNVSRHCTIINGCIGHDEKAADDGAYDLLDVEGSPEAIGKAIADSLAACDLLQGGHRSYLESGQPVYLCVTIKVEPVNAQVD